MAMRPSSRRNPRGTSDTARFVLVLLLLAGALYIALATSVGSFIAEKVIAPVFKLLDNGKPSATNPPASPDQTSPVNAAQPDGEPDSGLSLLPSDSADNPTHSQAPAETGSKSEEVRIEGKTLYALQLGAFKEKANAEATAHTLQARGAGGYVQQDADGLYRVLAAVYNDENSAKTVRKQIVDNDGLDAAVYAITAPAVAFRVTAGAAQVTAVRNAFDVLAQATDELGKICMEYDKKLLDAGSAKKRLADLSDAAKKPYDQLEASASSGQLANVTDTLKELISDLALFSTKEEGSVVDFSAAIKYTHIKTVCKYSQLLRDITAN